MGSYVDKDLIQILYQELAILAEYTLDTNKELDTQLRKICNQLNQTLFNFGQRLSAVENQQKETEITVRELADSFSSIQVSTANMNKNQEDLMNSRCQMSSKLDQLESKQTSMTTSLNKSEMKQYQLEKAVGELCYVELTTKQNELDQETKLMKTGIADVEKKVEKIHETLADREINPPKAFFQAPNRNKFFCGRETELERLKRILNVSGEHQLVGICGLGGCGKTTLASEFSWRSRNRYPGGVFWISVENDTLFRNTVTELAFQLQTFHSNFEECLRATLTSLSSISLPWLLVVDNADQLEIGNHLRKLLCGHWKRESKGHFLITTRRNARELCDAIDIEESQCVTLPCFKATDAEEFLLKRTEILTERANHNQEKQAVVRLIEELGGLPLALEQAAAHIKALRDTFRGYLDKYNKQKLSLLQQKKAKAPSEEISKERLAVHTTWLLNFDYAAEMARKCGLEEAVRLTIDASAFVAPDDIPWEMINQGNPNINLSIQDNQDRGYFIAQLTDILTKFSLFQSGVDGTFCVHRLVQQVVLSRLNNSRRKEVLLCTIRMINFAFEHNPGPEQLLKSNASVSLRQHHLEHQGSLAMWAKIASHATVVKGHLAGYIESCPSAQTELLYCVESAKLMQQTALFFSMNNLQTEALHSQKQLHAIVAGLGQQDHDAVSLFVKEGIKIPLIDDQQRLLLLNSRSKLSYPETSDNNEKLSVELRQAGNIAYGRKDYEKAIKLYSKALEVSEKRRSNAVEHAVLLANRAQCYLKLNKAKEAVEDSNECVIKDPKSWKGYCRRAIAMSMLANAGEEQYRMASIASASMAAHLNPSCKRDLRPYFPKGVETLLIVSSQRRFEEVMQPFLCQSQYSIPIRRSKGFFLVTEGKYHFPEHYTLGSSNADLIVFGEGEVEIDLSYSVLQDSSRFHFENISFDHANFLAFDSNGSVFNSVLKNGRQVAIDEELRARHNPNCLGCKICLARFFSFSDSTLHGGRPSLGLALGSHVIVQNCDILDAAGGILVNTKNSKVVVSQCKIRNSSLSALEARNGGSLYANHNDIHSAQWAGICIGPQAGECVVENNKVYGNAYNGIQIICNSCSITLSDNCVYRNGQHGVFLGNESQGTLYQNTIFENWSWGTYITDKSRATLDNNEIHNNKCGGVRLENNFSAKVEIVNNVIRDHTGPDICYSNSTELLQKKLGCHIEAFTEPPFVRNNRLERNNEGQQHPKSLIASLGSRCEYCHQFPNKDEGEFSTCSNCRKVRYCSKECQIKHWKKHKPFCSMLVGSFSIVIDAPKLGKKEERVFHPRLKGIGKGKKPNPKSKRCFIIKVQIQEMYGRKPDCPLVIYDQSTELDFKLQNKTLFHIVAQCGVLGCTMLTGKKIFCYAAFEDNGKKLRIFYDELAPFQEW